MGRFKIVSRDVTPDPYPLSAKRRKEQNYMLMFDEEQDKKEVQYEYVLPFSEPLPPSA